MDQFIPSQLGEGDVPVARLVCHQRNSLLKGKNALGIPIPHPGQDDGHNSYTFHNFVTFMAQPATK